MRKRNDRKVRTLYEDFYQKFGVDAAWLRPSRKSIPVSLVGSSRLTGSAKAKLKRVISKAPEVMVKVSGRTQSSDHLKEHMNYITRNGKVEAETDYGLMKGKEAVGDLHSDWSDDAIIYEGQHQVRKAALSVNLVLSMPAGTDRDAFRNAVRDFVDVEIRPRVDTIVAFHDDTEHPHAHVTVRGRQHNGRVFNPGKGVLERYRERFASALRFRGIEAEATPRFTRGRTLKADRQSLRHMKGRGQLPSTDAQTIDETYRERQAMKHGEVIKEKPWEKKVREQQQGLKVVYEAASKELAASNHKDDQLLARQIQRFVRDLPKPVFKRDLYREALDQQLSAHEKDREKPSPKNRDGPER